LSSGETTTEATPDSDVPVEEEVLHDERREHLLSQFTAELGDAVVGSHVRPDDTVWVRVTREAWRDVALFAKSSLHFEFFDFLSAIDWLPSPFGRDMDSQEDRAVHGSEPRQPEPMVTGIAGGETRFQLLARLYSIGQTMGVILKADLPDDDLRAGTWSDIYGGADWHERESWEMYGIEFVGHPGLRNIYLPSDFEGHPLRKDYPLLARRVKPWPGIVDVEPMPGTGDDESAEEGEGAES
jgi:NADH-quinone oxidoreductase subunit C